MQIRFLHDPDKDTGLVACALSSNIVRFFKTEDGTWSHEVYVETILLLVSIVLRRW